MQNTKPAPHEQIISIVPGFWQARALAVATELGLPDLLVDYPCMWTSLGAEPKPTPRHFIRLLRADHLPPH
jgi:hypothetical protein